MEPNNTVDNQTENGYNDSNDKNEFVVKMDEQAPLNDPNCKHLLVIDETDKIGDNVAWVCNRCGLGTFCPPGLDPNTMQ